MIVANNVDKEANVNSIDELEDSETFMNLAKKYLSAKMAYNLENIQKTKEDLKQYLHSEYHRMKSGDKNPKKMMMKKIRCALVKHPYDYIGRRMASCTKTLFEREILNET